MPKLVYTNNQGLQQKSGSGVTWNGSTCQGDYREVITHSGGTTTLVANNSGCIVAITGTSSGSKIILPAVASSAGMWFDVAVQASFATHSITIEANGSDNQIVIETAASTNATAVSTGDDVTLHHSRDAIGDVGRWICDGANWYAECTAATATFWTAG